MVHSVTLIEGDGIGPEVAGAARRVLEATGVAFRWDLAYAGQSVVESFGIALLDHVLESHRTPLAPPHPRCYSFTLDDITHPH